MANLTKAQRDSQEKIKQAIMDGYKRGVCDKSGKSFRNKFGHPSAMPRPGNVTRRFVKRDDGSWGWVMTDFSERHGIA